MKIAHFPNTVIDFTLIAEMYLPMMAVGLMVWTTSSRVLMCG